MKIRISLSGETFSGVLYESAASRDLVALLPLTLEFEDFAAIEKVARLPAPLSTAGQPAGADPAIGDIGYYVPWNNLVLYYGDQTYHEGIVILGHLTEGADRMAALAGMLSGAIERSAD